MPAQTDVSHHYTHGGLTDAIQKGLASLGKPPDTVTVDDLAAVDELHIGGRKASEDFLDQLQFRSGKHVLDVGCGLGGAARFVVAATAAGSRESTSQASTSKDYRQALPRTSNDDHRQALPFTEEVFPDIVTATP